MKAGEVVLASLQQADGIIKRRPVVLLRAMPPFDDWLVCGVSTKLHHAVPGLDEIIDPSNLDFSGSGLKTTSVIRLGFLTVLSVKRFFGILGEISPDRHRRLLENLSRHLRAP